MTDYSEAIHPESGDSGSPQEGLFFFLGEKTEVYLDALRIFNTHLK
jgi:hypothetical protein